jgi:hypothetical protein
MARYRRQHGIWKRAYGSWEKEAAKDKNEAGEAAASARLTDF